MWAEVWVRPYKTQLEEPWGYVTEENCKNGGELYFKKEQKDTAYEQSIWTMFKKKYSMIIDNITRKPIFSYLSCP